MGPKNVNSRCIYIYICTCVSVRTGAMRFNVACVAIPVSMLQRIAFRTLCLALEGLGDRSSNGYGGGVHRSSKGFTPGSLSGIYAF